MPRFDSVLWDLDGTICETRRDITAGINDLLLEYGHPAMSVAEVSRYVGWGSRVLISRCFTAQGAPPLGQEELDGAYRSFLAHYESHLLDTTEIYPGVGELLIRLSGSGIKMAVVTNKPERLAGKLIEALGLRDRFGTVLGGDSLSVRKPDPDPLNHAMGLLSSSRERTSMVGDSEIDLQSARAAGISVAVVAWGFSTKERLLAASPDIFADNPTVLERWILG